MRSSSFGNKSYLETPSEKYGKCTILKVLHMLLQLYTVNK